MSVISTATVHSIERMKERAGLKEKRAHKMIDLAVERGKSAEDFSSWERSYLLSNCSKDKTAVAYNGFCYIIAAGDTCVTMFPLPGWFGKKKHFNGKEYIRNMKSYARLYCV